MSADTTAHIKDVVVIIFLIFASGVLMVAAIMGLRLYFRVGQFMDRMERLADRLESAVANVTSAGRALRPVASGLGLLGLAQGIGRMFGSKGNNSNDIDNESS